MPREPLRLVSLVPSWTETLFAFGLGPAVVGVTRFCVHPEDGVGRVEKVGGTKDPDVARIAALGPGLVVCDREEQRREDVDAMRAAGLEVWVSDVRSVEGAARDVRSLGEAVGRVAEAEALAARIRDAVADVARLRPDPPVRAYVPIWRRPWMTPTDDTYAHHVLAACGVANVFGGEPGRYPERGPEEAIEAGAVAALLPTEPYPFHAKLDAAREELAEAGFPPERVVVVDGEALTWYGARSPGGIREVARVAADLAPSERRRAGGALPDGSS